MSTGTRARERWFKLRKSNRKKKHSSKIQKPKKKMTNTFLTKSDFAACPRLKYHRELFQQILELVRAFRSLRDIQLKLLLIAQKSSAVFKLIVICVNLKKES